MLRGTIAQVTGVGLLLTACGDAAVTKSTADLSANNSLPLTTNIATLSAGRLRITQQIGCCYTEGQISFLVVRDAEGFDAFKPQFLSMSPTMPVADLNLPSGT